MALTQINSGASGTAQTVDQFRQLLTGTMTDQPVTIANTIHGNALYDNGNRVVIQGSHSAGQVIISYGVGAPASLGANEIYIQLS